MLEPHDNIDWIMTHPDLKVAEMALAKHLIYDISKQINNVLSIISEI